MADRPILFSASMVRALMDGRKTQTRRIIKPQPPADVVRHCWYDAPIYGFTADEVPSNSWHTARLAAVSGDRLWVRESHAIVPRTAYRMSDGVQQTLRPEDNHDAAIYAAEWDRSKPGQWRPSIHMPRWASRLTLTVTDVRVERLQDISEDDAAAEGWPAPEDRAKTGIAEIRDAYPIGWYAWLWDSINGRGAWDKNPWVAAYSFTVKQKNIDEVDAA